MNPLNKPISDNFGSVPKSIYFSYLWKCINVFTIIKSHNNKDNSICLSGNFWFKKVSGRN